MNPAGLSLLTYPTLPWQEYPWQWVKRFAKLGLAGIALDLPSLRQIRHGGHPGVTRSALAGCRALDLPHNHNCSRPSDLYPWVLVLSSVPALKQAIRLREQGRIQHLWAGPNLVVLPTEQDGILSHPLIERVVVPSEWVAHQYIKLMPCLKGRVCVWPAGIDLEQNWSLPPICPKPNPHSLHILHYNKLSRPLSDSRWLPIYQSVRNWLHDHGCIQSELVYGAHRHTHYREALLRADVMLYWTDAGESQGLALLEAWAMDTPTLVSANQTAWIQGVKTEVSSAPYLSPHTGDLFRSAQEAIDLLASLLDVGGISHYQPRLWVEQNMTDRLSVQSLVSDFNRLM